MIASILKSMRYKPEHKLETHQKIVKDASRRVLAAGLTGAAVSAVMQDAGLTHGGFYKHFGSKDELLLASLSEAFKENTERMAQVGRESEPGTVWKAIVAAYLSPEHCEHVEYGCPLAALAPDLTRSSKAIKAQVVVELSNYRNRMLPFMPGKRPAEREAAFFAIFSTMVGAIEIARMLPEPAMRKRVLAKARNFLLRSFDNRTSKLVQGGPARHR